MPYFKVQQSVNINGPYLWYWYLHEATGHIYHISHGFTTYEKCVSALTNDGLHWMKDLNGE